MSTKLPKKCKSCGHTKFVKAVTQTSNDVSCANCGLVIEENPITAELSFSENGAGGSSLNGRMIRHDQSGSSSMKSREMTIANARRKINALASALRIPSTVADSAAGWFTLALSQNFVKGRKSQNVIASCLYVACRKERTHHMLIDFSSKLQVSVYSIGTTFLKMVKTLNITSLPLADPSLFINHFVDRLDFGNKKIKVLNDAVKLAQKMNQDWIYEGRRPAGIAGACVLLAARMNNFRRTHEEIVALAHVGEETLQKRLNEFKNTHASDMSISEFRNTNNEDISPSLPPSYMKDKKKPSTAAKTSKAFQASSTSLLQRFISDGVSETDIKIAIEKLCQQLDSEHGKGTKEKKRKVNNKKIRSRSGSINENSIGIDVNNQEGQHKERLKNIRKEQEKKNDSETDKSLEQEKEKENKGAEVSGSQLSTDDEEEIIQEVGEGEAEERIGEETGDREAGAKKITVKVKRAKLKLKLKFNSDKRVDKNGKLNNNGNAKEKPLFVDQDLKKENAGESEEEELSDESDDELVKLILENNVASTEDAQKELIEKNRPRNLVTGLPKTNDLLAKVSDEMLLSDLDEDEAEKYILNDDESKIKEQIFVNLNRDYLLELEQKRLKVESDVAAGHINRPTKRRRRNNLAKAEDDASQSLAGLGTLGDSGVMGDINSLAINGVLMKMGEKSDAYNASASMKNMLRSKQSSAKLNYNAIDTLFI